MSLGGIQEYTIQKLNNVLEWDPGKDREDALRHAYDAFYIFDEAIEIGNIRIKRDPGDTGLQNAESREHALQQVYQGYFLEYFFEIKTEKLKNVLQWDPRDTDCQYALQTIRKKYRKHALQQASALCQVYFYIDLEAFESGTEKLNNVLEWFPGDTECRKAFQEIRGEYNRKLREYRENALLHASLLPVHLNYIDLARLESAIERLNDVLKQDPRATERQNVLQKLRGKYPFEDRLKEALEIQGLSEYQCKLRMTREKYTAGEIWEYQHDFRTEDAIEKLQYVLKWDPGDTECQKVLQLCQLDGEQKFRRFITEVIDKGANGYFVSKIWLSSLDEHHWEAVVSVLGGAGYFEIYQTRTTMFYERMEDYTQATSICNDLASTPENKNACDGDTRLAAASDDSGTLGQIGKARLNADRSAPGDQLDFDGKTLPFDNEKEYPDEELEDSSSKEEDSDEKDKNANESTTVRINEDSLVDSPRSLLQGGETPLASSNEELRSFKKTVRDSNMCNDDLSLSTHSLSTLNHRDLNAALSKAGYSETYNTKTTSYFERIQSHFPNSQTNQGAIFSRSEKSNVFGLAGSSIVFQGSSDSLTDGVQGMGIVDKVSGVKNATDAIPKIEAKCECPLQLLTVSCTKPMRSQAGPSTSSSQVECNVTVPEGELLQIVSTGVDKDISMETFNYTKTLGHSKVDVPLNVSAQVTLSCCVTSDRKNVRIHILEIRGATKVGESFDKRTNALVFKSVRTNVDAWIKKSPARPKSIRLNIKEDNCPPPWRRVLHICRPLDNNGQRKAPEDLMWLDLTGEHPKNSRFGSKTLELQHHVKNRLKIDFDEDSHRALVLYFEGSPPVTFEGDILGDLDPNSFLELHIRHEVAISYNVPCDPRPTADAISTFTKRKNENVEFDCVLEFRTQTFSS